MQTKKNTESSSCRNRRRSSQRCPLPPSPLVETSPLCRHLSSFTLSQRVTKLINVQLTMIYIACGLCVGMQRNVLGFRMMRHKAKVRLTDANAKGRFECPVKRGVITSGFGPRWESFHHGIDLATNSGTPIVAAEDGVVKFAKWSGGYGNLLTIQHVGGYTTRCA